MTDAVHTDTAPNDTAPNDSRAGAMSLTLFVLGSALLYAGAMVLMKFWGQIPPVLLLTVIALLISGAVWFEIGALQTERLGMVYVLILGIECVFIALASALWFGESFTFREIAGGFLIVAGTAVAWS